MRDPYALRGLVLIACIATFFAAGGERLKRIAAAFDWQGVVLPANFRVDAWVMPPVYTGKPPIILPGIHPGEAFSRLSGPVAVPVNSTLVVRATGKVNLDVTGSGGVTPSKEEVHAPSGTQEHRFNITAAGAAALRGVGDDVTWSFNAIPDKPPTIALTKDPEQQSRGSLLLSYRIEDDYGVTEAQATFARKDDGSGQGEGAHPLYGPPDFALILPQARTKNGVGQTIKDLTDHPWAGADVVMTLIARDDGGNEGKSEPFAFRLPERVFTKPLARALVEQRRNLALDARSRPVVLTALDALAMAPEKFIPDAGVYLGLRSIFWSLVRAKTDDELRDVAARLWSMAVDIEDGDISDAQAALRNAEDALRQALERGASDQEIKAADGQAARGDGSLHAGDGRAAAQQPAAYQPARSQCARAEPARSKEHARPLGEPGAQRLSRCRPPAAAAAPADDGKPADGDAGHERRRYGRHDVGARRARRHDPPAAGFARSHLPPGPGPAPAERPARPARKAAKARPAAAGQRDGRAAAEPAGAARPAQQAARRFEEPRFRPGPAGPAGQQGQDELDQLGRAGEAMGEAEGELGDSDADSAVDSQGRALDALRKGAQGLAQSMQQQLGQGPGPGRLGRLGQPRAQQDTDPLGRPLRGRDYGDDVTVRVPGEIDVQRARRIIEELRKRFGDIGRPQEELDYIERLLKDY